ncbi:unnamed protein product [Acanthoscelides obtectus]|uniref:Uncharacterized protein n=1 Tax=Acanthoscelides obtectus TaxID=200917 RepID=A0A9P0KKJ2_ACAOB|nr:unnamed protein product [Acanthoscelides obtectus]CAK1641792.1 hypothetical protein AOBTE_LOCUS12635 [Acanthoscelides obtectus]
MSKCLMCSDKGPILLKNAVQCKSCSIYYHKSCGNRAKLLPDGSYNYYCGTGGQVHDEDFARLDPGFQLILKRLDKVNAPLSAIKSDIQSSSNKLTELEKSSDLTKKQQAHMQKIKNEVKHRSDKGEKDLKIKDIRGKPTIVKSIVADNQLNENDEDTE